MAGRQTGLGSRVRARLGGASIVLAVVKAAEAIDPGLQTVFRSKWGELKVTFLPEDLADALRVRLAGPMILAKASRVTCQICGRAARGDVDYGQEIVEVLCVGHRRG